MVSKKIQHPLRTIEIAYDEQKPFHPYEEQMLDRYTNLHNFVNELCEDYDMLMKQYESHDLHIKRVIARFKAIKGRMNHLGEKANKMMKSMMPDKQEAEHMLQEAASFKILLKDFHNELARLSAESGAMQSIFAPLDEKDEQLSAIFKDYMDFKAGIHESPNNYSLDFEKHDSDEMQFLGSMQNMANRQEEFVSVCNMVIDRYNLLIEEVEKTYEQWEKYNDTLEMMRLALVTPYNLTQVCLN
ncbi:MAG TPA: hypothetical protein VG603_00120 [Chitinophagales bacterium]|nr:hypothetical protein [Chitinophagales bacterium]